MKIVSVSGKEIFDSRGLPTLMCELGMDDGSIFTSTVPSGTSRSTYEAVEIRDGGKRLMGQGVLKAIDNLEQHIGPALIGREPDVVTLDGEMIELDGTENKSKLGANAILAASLAIFKAQAYMHEMQDYEIIAHLCEERSVAMPYPMFNILNGGVHADNGMSIQEILLVPMGAQNFRQGYENTVNVYYTLQNLLKSNGKSVAVGQEGGFAATFRDETEALDFVMEAIAGAGFADSGMFVIGLDVAATQLYSKKKKMYNWYGQELVAEQLIERYAQLAEKYPLYSLEDGLHEDDMQGWQGMMKALSEKIQIVGDDIFASNPARIDAGVQDGVANAVVIKPNQIGTLTETLQAIRLCKDNDLNIVISHRSGETNDTFIADLAVGTSAGQIKAGACNRGERIAKYNRLMEIEEELTFSMFDE